MEETKLCPRCERILPLDSFSKNSSRPDGLQVVLMDFKLTVRIVKDNKVKIISKREQ